MALFLRFKRARQTVFLDCDKGEQLAQLKARLCAIVDAPVDGVRFLRVRASGVARSASCLPARARTRSPRSPAS
jgi:hypothetical protein